jgi:hypothetical protein
MRVDSLSEKTRDSLEEITGDRPPKLRMQPTVYDVKNNYRAWPGVSWTLDCESVEEAKELKEALELFFTRVQAHGTAEVQQVLRLPSCVRPT